VRAEPAGSEQAVPPSVDEVLSGVQVGPLVGLAVELDQRGLDLRVAVDPVDLALSGAEGAHH
jgi:hypothetical protein